MNESQPPVGGGITVRYRAHFGKPGSRRKATLLRLPEAKLGDDTGVVDIPTPLAGALALGYRVDQAIDAGEFSSYADVVKHLRVSPTRISQLVRLTLLSPRIQERILNGELRISETALKPITRQPAWPHQEEAVDRIVAARAMGCG